MDKKKYLKEKELILNALAEKAQTRDYIGRDMVLNISIRKDNNFYTVIGKLIIKVSETPDIENSWKEIPFSVKVINNNEAQAIQQAMSVLNAIPARYGDGIFEDDFAGVFENFAGIAENQIEGINGK